MQCVLSLNAFISEAGWARIHQGKHYEKQVEKCWGSTISHNCTHSEDDENSDYILSSFWLDETLPLWVSACCSILQPKCILGLSILVLLLVSVLSQSFKLKLWAMTPIARPIWDSGDSNGAALICWILRGTAQLPVEILLRRFFAR